MCLWLRRFLLIIRRCRSPPRRLHFELLLWLLLGLLALFDECETIRHRFDLNLCFLRRQCFTWGLAPVLYHPRRFALILALLDVLSVLVRLLLPLNCLLLRLLQEVLHSLLRLLLYVLFFAGDFFHLDLVEKLIVFVVFEYALNGSF